MGPTAPRQATIVLPIPAAMGSLDLVKRWQMIGVGAVAALVFGYLIFDKQPFVRPIPRPAPAREDHDNLPRNSGLHPATISWQKLDRSGDGFTIEMPTDVKEIRIPAYTETGGQQQLDMIFSNPDAETTFSVAWQDEPPVARVNKLAADQTLEAARDGAVARTQTTLVSDAAGSFQGFPGRTFEARNSGGGVMNVRLVYAGSRLYMLVASFPSIDARRDRDVARFFNSFLLKSTSGNKKSAAVEVKGR